MVSDRPDEPAEAVEPDNSTVDDWFGQNVARDQDVAEEAMADAGGDAERAEELYENRAAGEATYDAGHPRPDDS